MYFYRDCDTLGFGSLSVGFVFFFFLHIHFSASGVLDIFYCLPSYIYAFAFGYFLATLCPLHDLPRCWVGGLSIMHSIS